MMRALSSGISGLKAHQTAMDVIGNNIANVDTNGFKSSNTIFRDALYQTIQSASASGKGASTDTGTAGVNPSQIGYGVDASSVDLNTSAGDFSATGKNMDCAIDGEGYFVIANGSPKMDGNTPTNIPSAYKYTRVGTFGFDSEGYLTDGTGNRVCGQTNVAPGKLDATTKTLSTLDASNPPQYIHYDKATNDLDNVAVSSDGTVTATNDGVAVTVGKVALARFQNPAGLTQAGNSFYNESTNSGTAAYAAPNDKKVGTGALKSGGLESSNVDLATEFANMITYERGYQANSKIMSVADEMLETLVNMKR